MAKYQCQANHTSLLHPTKHAKGWCRDLDDLEKVEALLNDNSDTKHEIIIPLFPVENTISPLVEIPQNQSTVPKHCVTRHVQKI